MGTVVRTILMLFLLSILVACKKESKKIDASLKHSDRLVQKIDSIGNHFIEQGKVLGFSIAVLQKGDTLYNKAFGHADIGHTKPATTNTIFLMASISKLVGSTMIMKLVEEGKLNLDDTLLELLPDFPNKKQASKIKLRHLISHTSGLAEYSKVIDSIYVKNRINPGKDDLYKFFSENDLVYEPGTNYSYCNSGFVLMGMIVEKVTGKTFTEELDRIINEPTGFNIKLIGENTVNPNMSEYVELHGIKMIPEPHWTWIKGDGGMTATAIELAHFPFKWSDGTIISKKSFQQMITPTLLSDSIATGYGLGVRSGSFEGEKIIGHTGGHKSFKSKLIYMQEKQVSIVVMVNTDNTPTHANEIFAEVAAIFLQKKHPAYSENDVTTIDLSKYEGVYARPDDTNEEKAQILLNKEGTHLYYRFNGSKSEGEKMHYLGNNEFWIEKWPWDRITFDINKKNESRALREYYYGFYVELRKKVN